MPRYTLSLIAAVTVSGCGIQATHLSKRTAITPPRPPFSAWDCDDSGHQAYALNTVTDQATPRWAQDLATDVAIEATQAILSASSTKNARHVVMRRTRGDIPLCRLYSRADDLNGHKILHSQDPAAADLPLANDDWDDALASAASIGVQFHVEDSLSNLSATPCLWDDEHELVAAWDIDVMTAIGPIHGFANGAHIFAAAPRAFDIDGTARIYDHNSEGSLIDATLHDLDPSGLLKTGRFTTSLPRGIAPAKNTSGQFIVDPTHATFGEISLFANAELMADWFDQREKHHSLGCLPIEIKPHYVFSGGNINNGTYKADDGDGHPVILMGDGDGIDLKNLSTDMEAVSHEIGHHIIYRTLTDTADAESVTLHEALADFFVFARTNNPCLGDTLCPEASGICYVKNQCLRTADNSLNFTDPDLPKEAHRRSQLFSGMLWDLGLKLGLDTVTAIVFKSIDYLLPRSTYRDLIAALALADTDLNRGINACAIFQEAENRGLSERLTGLDCHNYLNLQGQARGATP